MLKTNSKDLSSDIYVEPTETKTIQPLAFCQHTEQGQKGTESFAMAAHSTL